MGKKTVLERFQVIKELEVADDLGTVADVLPYFCKNVDEALLRLKEIDNANSSEALKYLEKLGTHRIEYREGFELGYTKTMPFKSTMEYKAIQYALLKAQEQDFNYNEILMPFVNELAEILGTKDMDELFDKIEQQNKALNIIMKEPYQCAPTILYIQINKNNPKMLNYEHYVMSVKAPLPEEDFDSLEEMILNA